MAFVRKKGNQLAIVHGHRDASTGEVVQTTLFTFFSKTEALRAIGKGACDDSRYFQNLLREQYPAISFDWDAICRGVMEQLDVLPDEAEYREERLAANFKKSLWAFTRELVETEPQMLAPSAKLLREHKGQLEFLRDVIDFKLSIIEGDDDDLRPDNEFYWHHALRAPNLSPDVEELAADLYQSGNYDAATSAFKLLTVSFPGYAEGHNYLGLMNLDRGRLQESIDDFRRTVDIGRKLFPKRMRKDHYWLDLNTRPYMRGLRNLALALNRQGSYVEALTICDKLESECNDTFNAAAYRAAIFLNCKQWHQAESSARGIMSMAPMEGVIAAFSQYEQGQLPEARQHFLFAALNNTLGIEIVITGRSVKPKDFAQSEDYNGGVELRASIAPYLAERSRKCKDFFSAILKDPKVRKALAEVSACAAAHSQLRDTRKHRANFERWRQLQSMEFAREMADKLSH